MIYPCQKDKNLTRDAPGCQIHTPRAIGCIQLEVVGLLIGGQVGQIGGDGVLPVVSSAFSSQSAVFAVLLFPVRLLLPLILIILLAGCRASGPLVVRTSPTLEGVNAQLNGKRAEIRLVDGSRIKVAQVHATPDSVTYVVKSQLYRRSGRQTVPLTQVNRITYSPSFPTLIRGLVGALPGGLLIYKVSTAKCSSSSCEVARVLGPYLGAGIALLGASLGILIGYQYTERIVVYEGEPLNQAPGTFQP